MRFLSFVKLTSPNLYFICFAFFCMSLTSFISREQIIQEAFEKNLPIVAIFFGEEDCPWSQRVKQDLLPSSAFEQRVSAEAILWQVAWHQDEESWQYYRVESSPCFVLLDPQGKEFARVDYNAAHPMEFSRLLLSLIDDFHSVCSAIDQGLAKQNEKALQDLYIKAQRFSIPCFKQMILTQGLKKEKGTFFHLEKYQALLEKSKGRHPAVVKLRKEILSKDPNNRWGTQRKLALLEFKKKAAITKRKASLKKILSPLLNYLKQFGAQDEENRWEVEMAMAEFLFSKQAIKQALLYAKQASRDAPQDMQSRILKTAALIQEGSHAPALAPYYPTDQIGDKER